jgi:hypothetical protein
MTSESASTTTQSAQLPDSQALNDIEDTRDLIARRNQALDSLELDSNGKDALAAELNEIGWPSSLSKGGPRIKRAMHMPYPKEDMYALLCIKRHTDAPITELGRFFKNENLVRLKNKFSKMMSNIRGKHWKEEDDDELIRLYEVGDKSFQDIARQDFSEFRESVRNFADQDLQIEIAYFIAKNRRPKGTKK